MRTSRPERAASVPSCVSEILLATVSFSLIMPLRPFRSLTALGSASDSGTGPSSIRATRSSSGVDDDSIFLPWSLRETVLESPSPDMAASFLRMSQPMAILSSPGILEPSSDRAMDPPASSMMRRARRSGRPSLRESESVRLYERDTLSSIRASPLDWSHEADPMISTSSWNPPSDMSSAGEAEPPAASSARSSLFSL